MRESVFYRTREICVRLAGILQRGNLDAEQSFVTKAALFRFFGYCLFIIGGAPYAPILQNPLYVAQSCELLLLALALVQLKFSISYNGLVLGRGRWDCCCSRARFLPQRFEERRH